MASKRRPLNAKVALNLRLTASLHRQLKCAAQRQGHSLNREIVRRLEEHEVRVSLIEAAQLLARGRSDGQQAAPQGQASQAGRPLPEREAQT